MEDEQIIVLINEDGQEERFVLIEYFDVDGEDYIIAQEEREDGFDVIFRVEEEGGEEVLVRVEDDTELKRVETAYYELEEGEEE
jgi:uncharacterized protein YrzB (UPF0473 family)